MDFLFLILNFTLLILAVILSIFCLIQLVDLLFRDLKYFESHTHKLTWFLVLIIGNVLGAIWYFLWKREFLQKEKKERQKKSFERKKNCAR